MRGRTRVLATVTVAGALTFGMMTPLYAAPPVDNDENSSQKVSSNKADEVNRDALPLSPEQQEQRNRRMEAVNAVVSGKAAVEQRGESRGVQLPDGTWVQWGTPKTEKIFTLLVQFSDTDCGHGGAPGPQANEIPEPDRSVNNTTAWEPDYNRDYYQNMLFGKTTSMTDFYLKQSSGRYTVNGHVENWVTLPCNEARYGYDADEAEGYGAFLKDSTQAWYDAQVAAGKTDAQIKQYLSEFDIWDRNDYDADGNFDEADGYIDHIQIIHAGVGDEADGDANTDAIWSHSWTAQSNLPGPDWNPNGGVPFGTSGVWVGAYTTEPENGGLGVFAHEYGHDLGLPDLYDTKSGNNGTGFWTLMSSGSWLGMGKDRIGEVPGFMGPWEKLFLGWLDYDTVDLDQKLSYNLLGAAGGTSPFKEATLVNLPPVTVTKEYTKPASGAHEWMGGDADDINAALTRDLDLTGATSASITAKVSLDTEQDYDYFFGQVSTDNGGTWTNVGQKYSGNNGGFADIALDLTPYAGQKVKFRYRYTTDSGTHFSGVFLDDVRLTKDGVVAWSDDVESGDNGWTAYNWKLTTGTETTSQARFYLVENRQYISYDQTLKVGPYQRGWGDTKPDLLNHYSYQNGALIWFVDTTVPNNDNSRHPGRGLVLPVDAHTDLLKWSNGATMGNTQQTYDATFTKSRTDKTTFYLNGVQTVIPSRPGVSTFDDSDPNRYWVSTNPQNSTKVAGEGVKIKIIWDGSAWSPMLISVQRSK